MTRIILLILKTNDLTRALDESLHTRQGPARGFLILARYCARTVLRERVDEIREASTSSASSLLLRPARLLAAWLGYLRIELKLGAFELWLSAKRALGLNMPDFGAAAAAGPGLTLRQAAQHA